jgi:hypothetical protein
LPKFGDLTKATAIRLATHLNKLGTKFSDDELNEVLEHVGWAAETMTFPGENVEETWLGPALDVQMLRWWMKTVARGKASEQSPHYWEWAKLAVARDERLATKGGTSEYQVTS